MPPGPPTPGTSEAACAAIRSTTCRRTWVLPRPGETGVRSGAVMSRTVISAPPRTQDALQVDAASEDEPRPEAEGPEEQHQQHRADPAESEDDAQHEPDQQAQVRRAHRPADGWAGTRAGGRPAVLGSEAGAAAPGAHRSSVSRAAGAS